MSTRPIHQPTVRQRLAANLRERRRTKGISQKSTEEEEGTIAAALDILSRRLREGELLATAPAVVDFLRLQAHGLTQEIFAVLFLDTRLRLITYERMFSGTLDETYVYPREIAKRALAVNAASVVLHHNHPGGTCTPSAADLLLTLKLRAALELVGVTVIDHAVSGVDGVSSMAASGLI